MKKIFVLIPISAIILSISFNLIASLSKEYAAVSSNIVSGPILIIDPGHGGADGGAVALDGTKESELNLNISLKIQQISALFGIDPIMTRDREDLEYPESADTIAAKKKYDTKSRCDLINSYSNAVLISVHGNNFPSKSVSGFQVLYAPTDYSHDFAKIMENNAAIILGDNSVRISAKINSSIYIMNNISCPAVLAECGFLSNDKDLSLLKDRGHGIKLSMIFLSSYFEYCRLVSQDTYV